MSTGFSWEGIRRVRPTLLGARHVPERLCGGYVYLGRYRGLSSVRPLPLPLRPYGDIQIRLLLLPLLLLTSEKPLVAQKLQKYVFKKVFGS